jgi:hypothetical protein
MSIIHIINDLIILVALLNVFALMLINFRKDRSIVLKDLAKMFKSKSFAYRSISLVSIFFVLLPISIPFSIVQIMNDSNE